MGEPVGSRPRRAAWRRVGWVGLGVLLGAIPAANLALMVPAVKLRVEKKMSALAGSEMTVGSIRYWPWEGVAMGDVKMAEGGRVPGMVAADEVLVKVSPFAVFSDDIDVPLVRVTRPVIDVEWKKIDPVVVAAVGRSEQRPPVVAAPSEGGKSESEPEAEAAPAVVEAKPVAKAGGGEKPEAERPARGKQLVLGIVEVVDGSFGLAVPGIEEDMLSGRGIELQVDFSTDSEGDRVIGQLAIGELEAGGRIKVEGIGGEVLMEGGAVRIKGVEAAMGGGVIQGEVAMAPGAGGLPFEMSLNAENVDLGEVSGEGIEGFTFSGVLDGELKVGGYGTVPGSWRGQGGFKIAELGVAGGGTQVVLMPTEVSGTLQGGWVKLDRFYAHSDELALRASGGAVIDGRLGITLRVYIDREISRAVAKKLELLGGGQPSGMQELEGTHYAFRDVGVRGTLVDPTLVLWEGGGVVRPADFLRCFVPEGDVVEPFIAQ